MKLREFFKICLYIILGFNLIANEGAAQSFSEDRFSGKKSCIVEFSGANLVPSAPPGEFTTTLRLVGGVFVERLSSKQIQNRLFLGIVSGVPYQIQFATVDFLLDDQPFQVSDQISHNIGAMETGLWSLSTEFVSALSNSSTVEFRVNGERGRIEGRVADGELEDIAEALTVCISNDWR